MEPNSKCECKEPKIDRWSYVLIGLVGTHYYCKCGGFIGRNLKVPKDIQDQVDRFWNNPDRW